jgi:hypothetical protein
MLKIFKTNNIIIDCKTSFLNKPHKIYSNVYLSNYPIVSMKMQVVPKRKFSINASTNASPIPTNDIKASIKDNPIVSKDLQSIPKEYSQFLENFNALPQESKIKFLKTLKIFTISRQKNLNLPDSFSLTASTTRKSTPEDDARLDEIISQLQQNALKREIRAYNSFSSSEVFFDFDAFLLENYHLDTLRNGMDSAFARGEYFLTLEYNKKYRPEVPFWEDFGQQAFESEGDGYVFEYVTNVRENALKKNFAFFSDFTSDDVLLSRKYGLFTRLKLESLLNSYNSYIKVPFSFTELTGLKIFYNYSLFFDKVIYNALKAKHTLHKKSISLTDSTIENAENSFSMENQSLFSNYVLL